MIIAKLKKLKIIKIIKRQAIDLEVLGTCIINKVSISSIYEELIQLNKKIQFYRKMANRLNSHFEIGYS